MQGRIGVGEGGIPPYQPNQQSPGHNGGPAPSKEEGWRAPSTLPSPPGNQEGIKIFKLDFNKTNRRCYVQKDGWIGS